MWDVDHTPKVKYDVEEGDGTMEESICKFVSTRRADEGINIINFVYEHEACFPQQYLISATYTAAIVTGGCGVLHMASGDFDLQEGDLFFTYPAKPYYIENCGQLNYAYITFVGIRAIGIMERLRVSVNRPVCSGFGFLCGLWKDAFSHVTDANIDMICEGILLYTLSFVCSEKEEHDSQDVSEGILRVKQFIDLHYTDSGLNLKTVSERFSYNPKYLSASFKRMVKVNFSEYLCARRLEHAERLIESGIENVNELTEKCGYSDPLYFSKSFKAKYGVAPKKYITDQKKSASPTKRD